MAMKKYTTLVYLKLILGQTGQMGTLKTCFGVGSKYGFGPPNHPVYRFEIHQGCDIFYAESDGTIYFGLSEEMAMIQAIFQLGGWFDTTPEGGKSTITPSILQKGLKIVHHQI